ncbi:racemase, partial [Enterococcus faecalis]|nr:racemase [Enterococcus faecalis]
MKFAQQLGVFYDAQNYFTLPIVAVLVVILCFNLENIRIPGSDFLRKSSIIIYLVQNPIKYLLFYAPFLLGLPQLTYDNFKTYFVQV